MSITIKTRLDAGIYRSQGGGQVKTHYEYTTGPRNLVKAVAQYFEHAKEMEQGYGNIGCGVTWIEIDGRVVDGLDLFGFFDTEDGMTPTKRARELIASKLSHEATALIPAR